MTSNVVAMHCNRCRQSVQAPIALERSGDAAATCPTKDCGHVVKIPAAFLKSKATLAQYLDGLQKAQDGQVLAAVAEAEATKRQADFDALFK